MEAGVVIDLNGEPLFWHVPANRNEAALPDSRSLWDVLWENRDNLAGFAHSHPGGGVPGPSYTDVTTFSAIELGLGRQLDWWITSDTSIVVLRWEGPHKYTYRPIVLEAEPVWVPRLRELSYSNSK